MLAGALVLGCGSSKLPPPDPYTGLGPGAGGTPGAGDGGGTGDAGFDAGADAGSGACDGGCLPLGQVCDRGSLEPNDGCAAGLMCELNLSTGTTYTCQANNGDF
jgi:hypothetical protein